jgi:hypothetical protein
LQKALPVFWKYGFASARRTNSSQRRRKLKSRRRLQKSRTRPFTAIRVSVTPFRILRKARKIVKNHRLGDFEGEGPVASANLEMDRVACLEARRDDDAADALAQLQARMA